MAGADGAGCCQGEDFLDRTRRLAAVAVRQVGHHTHVGDVGVAGEQQVVGHPGDAARRVTGRCHGCRHVAVAQIHHVAVFYHSNAVGPGELKRCLVIEGQVQLGIEQLVSRPLATVDTHLGETLEQVIQPVDMVKMAMGEQDTLHDAVPYQRQQWLHITTIHKPYQIIAFDNPSVRREYRVGNSFNQHAQQ